MNLSFELTINVKPERAWDALINEIGLWWDPDYYTSEKTRSMVLEAKPGGRWYEDFGENNGLVWAEIIGIDAPRSFQFRGQLAPEYGGPAISIGKISIKDEVDFCKLQFEEAYVGKMTESGIANIKNGWKSIFTLMKDYLEA